MIDFVLGQCNYYLVDNDTEEQRLKMKNMRTRDYYLDMLNRCQTMFDWHGLPDTIPQRNLELILQSCGNVCITKVNGNLYAFWGGLGGVPDEYYEPTIYTVANPALDYSAELKIGTECIRMRNDATGQGLTPIFMRYAPRLTENDISMNIMDILYRIGNLISASDDRTAASARQYLDDIISGKIGYISESEFFEGLKVAPSGRTGENIKDLIEYHQYLKASWYNDLGINANYNMKRERIMEGEADQNEDALLTLVDNMLEMRRKACEKINELYGVDWSVDLAGAWLKEQKIQTVEGVDFDTDKDENINEEDRDPDLEPEEGEGTEADPEGIEEGPEADPTDAEGEPDQEPDGSEEEEAGDNVNIEVNIEVNTDGSSEEKEVIQNEENNAESDNPGMD